MTLEHLTAVSQLIGTVAVVASLVFVGLQIRQNTKATRAQVHQDFTSSYLSAAESITAHAATSIGSRRPPKALALSAGIWFACAGFVGQYAG